MEGDGRVGRGVCGGWRRGKGVRSDGGATRRARDAASGIGLVLVTGRPHFDAIEFTAGPVLPMLDPAVVPSTSAHGGGTRCPAHSC